MTLRISEIKKEKKYNYKSIEAIAKIALMNFNKFKIHKIQKIENRGKHKCQAGKNKWLAHMGLENDYLVIYYLF